MTDPKSLLAREAARIGYVEPFWNAPVWQAALAAMEAYGAEQYRAGMEAAAVIAEKCDPPSNQVQSTRPADVAGVIRREIGR